MLGCERLTSLAAEIKRRHIALTNEELAKRYRLAVAQLESVPPNWAKFRQALAETETSVKDYLTKHGSLEGMKLRGSSPVSVSIVEGILRESQESDTNGAERREQPVGISANVSTKLSKCQRRV